jgi:hypothetical protein
MAIHYVEPRSTAFKHRQITMPALGTNV